MSSRLTLDAGRAGVANSNIDALQAVATFLRELAARIRRRREASVFRDELRGLDDHMLHDLGIDRSEIGSVASEMAGLTDPTRLRALLASNL
ncbi:MAG TPA: DUF1127 domain-containing protein, partial [Casimicrobiaceae bacterium]|nr:DUF1127 domain-containing protein [Casimicrobiaceae bacterium]